MARPNRLREIAQDNNEFPLDMLLRLLNEHGTVAGAARELGLSYQTVWMHVNRNFEHRSTWVIKKPITTIDVHIPGEAA